MMSSPLSGKGNAVGTSDHNQTLLVEDFSQSEDIKWRFGDINWTFVFRSQLWGTALLTIGPIIALGVIHWALHPKNRPYYIYDGTISYPTGNDTIPTWVAVLIPFIMLMISITICEFILLKNVHCNITNAVSTALHFLIDLVFAFLFCIFMTELTKTLVGRLRPDFLARCLPDLASSSLTAGSATSFSTQSLSIGMNSAGSEAAFPCTGNAKEVKQGRLSFPSGHASSSTLFAFYNTGYFIWSLYFRHRYSVMGPFVERKGWHGVFLKDMGQSIGFYWVLAQICFCWGVGISRVIDSKHAVGDVIGGFFLGAMIGLVFVLRAIPTSKYVVGRGPEYNMAHSFDEKSRTSVMSRQSVLGSSAAQPAAIADAV